MLNQRGFRAVCAGLVLGFIATIANAAPDSFMPGKFLWNGQQPYVAVDYQKNIVHIAYLNATTDAVEYRTGDLKGNFGAPEKAFPMKLVSPRIRLDKNGVPHMVAATNMWEGNETIYYTNRLGGTWKTPAQVMDGGSDGTKNTINPYLCVGPDNRAYVSCQSSHNGSITGALFRIDNINTTPKVTTRTKSADLLITIMFFKGNDLWGVGGSPFKAGKRWFAKFNTETLKPGNKINASFSGRGEGLGASIDHKGDIHCGGIGTNKTGSYNRLSWAQSGKKAITFKSTNGHENGSAVPIRDRVAKDRVYVFYWDGGTEHTPTNTHVVKDCAIDNQMVFMRVENGKKAVDDKPVTDNPAPHGRSGRTPQAVAAHPNGGVIVVHEMCPKPDGVPGADQSRPWTTLGRRLMFTIVGDCDLSGVPSIPTPVARPRNAAMADMFANTRAHARPEIQMLRGKSADDGRGCFTLRGTRVNGSSPHSGANLIVVPAAR